MVSVVKLPLSLPLCALFERIVLAGFIPTCLSVLHGCSLWLPLLTGKRTEERERERVQERGAAEPIAPHHCCRCFLLFILLLSQLLWLIMAIRTRSLLLCHTAAPLSRQSLAPLPQSTSDQQRTTVARISHRRSFPFPSLHPPSTTKVGRSRTTACASL